MCVVVTPTRNGSAGARRRRWGTNVLVRSALAELAPAPEPVPELRLEPPPEVVATMIATSAKTVTLLPARNDARADV